MYRLNQLGKDSLIYGLGGILAKGIGFILLPIYTRIFTPADYGRIEMMTVIVSLLTAFLVMGMDSAQSFYFFQQNKNGKPMQKILVSAILQWRLTWGLGIIVIAGALAPLMNLCFFDGKIPWIYFAVSFSGALFTTLMSQSVEILRLLYRPWPYVCVTVLSSVLGAGLVLIFVLVFQQGIFGFFLGPAIASMVVTFFGWYLVRDYLDFSSWHYQWWPKLLKFGAPLLPAGLAFYAMSAADRWFVMQYHGEEALGLYSVAAKFTLVMALAVDTFRKAWWPIAMDSMHSDDGPETFRKIARLFVGLGVASIVYLTFLAPIMVEWLAGPAFQEAWPLIGIMVWQAFFYGFFLIGSAGIWKAEKTYVTAILMALAAVLNLLLNYLWVPSFGAMGAALATAASYFAWIVVSLLISETYWQVKFPFGVMASQIVLGATVVYLLTWHVVELIQSVIITHVAVSLLVASSIQHTAWKEFIVKVRKLIV